MAEERAPKRQYAENAEGAENAENGTNELTAQIIGCAIQVHKTLGPGLLESTYEACLVFDLEERGLRVKRQKLLPVHYRGRMIASAYRVDLLVEDVIIVELKTVSHIEAVHEAQLLSYLRLSGCPAGLLINFSVKQLTRGVRRIVNQLPEPSPRSLRPPRSLR